MRGNVRKLQKIKSDILESPVILMPENSLQNCQGGWCFESEVLSVRPVEKVGVIAYYK